MTIISFGIFDLNGQYFPWGEKEICFQYKRIRVLSFLSITDSYFLSSTFNKDQGFFLFVLEMTQGQLLGVSGDMKNGEGTRKRLKISVPHFDNSALIKSFSKTLIGRCMNPEEQDMKALFLNLPKIWKVENGVSGADLGFGKFQFHFEREEDMEAVLKQQPYHFDYWMLALARWQPKKPHSFPSEIPFWVRLAGLPMEFKTVPTYESNGDAIGKTVEVDIDNGRVLVVVDGFKELCFETTLDFKGGEFYDGQEEVLVSLRYEKLFGYCNACSSLCHKEEKCPLRKKSLIPSPEKKSEFGEGYGRR